MRHHYKRKKLGLNADGRRRLLQSLLQSFIRHGQVTSTKSRIKALSSKVDRLVTLSRKKTSFAEERITQIIDHKDLVKQFRETVIPQFSNRSSGFTRRILLKQRRGDNAEIARLEWVISPAEKEEKSILKDKKG